MWIEYNNNPCGRRVGDCAVRAISIAFGIDWEDAFEALTRAAFWMCDMPSSDSVWGSLLRSAGYYRHAIENTCPDCYTAAMFAEDHPDGTYVLAFGGHVATVVNGDIFDSWDSSQEIPVYYWSK